MRHDVNDIHGFASGFKAAMSRLNKAEISEHNKTLIKRFIAFCRNDNLKQSTYTDHLNILVRIVERVQNDLDKLTEDDITFLFTDLETEGYSPGYIRNYKKTLKKFYTWVSDGDLPKYIREIKTTAKERKVSPSDLLTDEEANKLLEACRNMRDKALIALLLDSGLRVGAVGSLLIENVALDDSYGTVRPNPDSLSNKTFSDPVPITWSSGYVCQWLSVHPFKEDPKSPLFVNIGRNYGTAMTYKGIRTTIKEVAERAGIKKKVNPHSFRHRAVSKWILEGFSEQEIKHRSAWSKDSRMLSVYGHFTSEDINNKILSRYGVTKEQIKEVKLTTCPRCNTPLPPNVNYCPKCSLILNEKMQKEFDISQKDLDKSMSDMIESKLDELIEKRAAEILEEKFKLLEEKR